MIALVIDGPRKGDLIESASIRYVAITIPKRHAANLIMTDYYIHSFLVAGQLINIASVQVIADKISQEDIYNAIISDKAKRATKL